MKALLLTITILLGIFHAHSQVPQAISYQAVARDLGGNVLANQDVSLKISIISGSISGTLEYAETHDVRTNQFGLINIRIGMGTASEGYFSTIDWGSNPFFSKIDIDINDGNGYQEIGISQILAVPYALYAAKAHDTDFNFIITGIADVKSNIGESISMPINLHWISGDQTIVTLSATSIPEGVNLTFEKNNENPDFASKINIEVTRGATKGVHTISIIGTVHNGRIRNYSFDLEILSTLSAELTVKDATTWTPENPDLDPAANATIKLYASQASLDNNIPEFTLITDADGFVKTYDITPGEYLMLVEKNNLSNVIDGYLIAGVFQNQAEIDNGNPQQAGATVGGVRYTDVNGDGIITIDDKVYHDNIAIAIHQTVSRTIVIGEVSTNGNTFWTEEGAFTALNICRKKMNDFVKNEYLFDGVFTGTTPAQGTSWYNIRDKNLNAVDNKISFLWTGAYSSINQANILIDGVQKSGISENTRYQLIGKAKAIRALLYYHLTNWFGEVPLVLEPLDPFDPIARNTISEVYTQIKSDLQAAQSVLSFTSGEEISNYFVMALLARLYAQQEDWDNTALITDQLINSTQFSLVANPEDAFKSSSMETILGFERGSDIWFNNFFTKGDFVPVIRFTEILLLRAESLVQLGQTSDALVIINQLRERRSATPLVGSQTVAELKQEILNNWETELANEGGWFYTLKRFGEATNKLQLQQYNLVLPIPMNALESNPYLTQNPGY